MGYLKLIDSSLKTIKTIFLFLLSVKSWIKVFICSTRRQKAICPSVFSTVSAKRK
jgi:hypothetical protein